MDAQPDYWNAYVVCPKKEISYKQGSSYVFIEESVQNSKGVKPLGTHQFLARER